MTKKDYIIIAKVLAAQAQYDANFVRNIAEAFASVLAADNPRFDRVRFLAACYKGD